MNLPAVVVGYTVLVWSTTEIHELVRSSDVSRARTSSRAHLHVQVVHTVHTVHTVHAHQGRPTCLGRPLALGTTLVIARNQIKPKRLLLLCWPPKQ